MNILQISFAVTLNKSLVSVTWQCFSAEMHWRVNSRLMQIALLSLAIRSSFLEYAVEAKDNDAEVLPKWLRTGFPLGILQPIDRQYWHFP